MRFTPGLRCFQFGRFPGDQQHLFARLQRRVELTVTSRLALDGLLTATPGRRWLRHEHKPSRQRKFDGLATVAGCRSLDHAAGLSAAPGGCAHRTELTLCSGARKRTPTAGSVDQETVRRLSDCARLSRRRDWATAHQLLYRREGDLRVRGQSVLLANPSVTSCSSTRRPRRRITSRSGKARRHQRGQMLIRPERTTARSPTSSVRPERSGTP